MMIITGLAGEIGQEIVETDLRTGSDLLTDDVGGVENEIIVTGETTPMIGLEGAARILLTRGPIAEAKTTVGSLQADLRI